MNNVDAFNLLGTTLAGEDINEDNYLGSMLKTANTLDPEGEYTSTNLPDVLEDVTNAFLNKSEDYAYQNGAWVEQGGGGGGGIENALVETDSVTWIEDGGIYGAEFNLDPNIDPLAVPASLGVIFGDNAYVLPAAGSTPPDSAKFGTWTESGPSFATYPVAAMLDTNDTQYDLLLVMAADGSVTKITVFA